MSPAVLLAMLMQMGVCAPAPQFASPDGQTLTIVVCPLLKPPPSTDDAPKEDSQ